MISNSNFKSVKQKFVDFVTSDEIMSIVFNLVYGFNETKEIKFFDGDSRDNVLEGFIDFMQGRNFDGQRFSNEINGFIGELDVLYLYDVNNCAIALRKLVKAMNEDCCKRGEKASVESVMKIHTVLLSVGMVEISKAEAETASNVLTIVAILTNIIVYFTRSGL